MPVFLTALIASVALVSLSGAWSLPGAPALSKFAEEEDLKTLADAWVCPTATTTAPYFCSEYCGFYSLSFTSPDADENLTQRIVEECPRDDCVQLFPEGVVKPDKPFCLYNFTTPTAHVDGAKAVCCCPDNREPCSESSSFEYFVAAKLAHTEAPPSSTTTEEPTSPSTTEESTTTEDTSTNTTPSWPQEETTTGSSTPSSSSEEPGVVQVSKISCTHVMAVSHPSSSNSHRRPDESQKVHVTYSAECDVEVGALKQMVKAFFA